MVIGIAGGIGSGKSTVLGILEQEYGAYVCMADELGHRALISGTGTYQQILDMFGEEIVSKSGEIDREALARIVYRDTKRLGQLNGIIHPFVLSEIKGLIDRYATDRLFVLETAILFETGCDRLCDEVWGVLTENEIRIRRLMESRGYSRNKAEDIMKNQISNSELAKKCDRVIVNDGEREELEQYIRECVENLLEKER